ncbi:Pumilio domain-containing protein C6G9.14 [Diplonema papillatum]|nr:Pumilio domain-containing protein C6G9.14 [Diplonema papillatum]
MCDQTAPASDNNRDCPSTPDLCIMPCLAPSQPSPPPSPHKVVLDSFNDSIGHRTPGEGEYDFLRIPSFDIRPNSAPAMIPKVPVGHHCNPPGFETQTLPSEGTEGETQRSHGDYKPGLLSTPIQGSLDFSFPLGSEEPHSFVSTSLEQELRRDAEIRGRSLSPRKLKYESVFSCSAKEGVSQPAGKGHEPRPGFVLPQAPDNRDVTNCRADDLLKLRMQQDHLASQLRSLQEQEWAILERRPSLSNCLEHAGGAPPPATASPAMKLSPGQQPAAAASSLQDLGSPSIPTSREQHDASYFADADNVHPSAIPSDPLSSPPSSTHTPASYPAPAPNSPGTSTKSTVSTPLLAPHMLDLAKNPAPPGHRLDAFVGQIGQVAKDQHGCRFLQKLCEEGNPREVTIIFDEVISMTGEMMIDPFGNYLMQKLCEHCTEPQRTVLIARVAAEIPNVSFNMHGTRAVQKVVDQLRTPEQVNLLRRELSQHTVEMIKDLNGNHVIQKCLQKFDFANKQFVYDAVAANVCEVGMHRHGCCVLQRCIDFGSETQKKQLIEEVISHALALVQDPFGNYVVQYVLEQDDKAATERVVCAFLGSIARLVRNKFSSNVVEKCIKLSTACRMEVLTELTSPPHIAKTLQDQYGNYVVQTALNTATVAEFEMLSAAIRPYLNAVKNTPHGKKIEAKLARRPGGGGGHDLARSNSGLSRGFVDGLDGSGQSDTGPPYGGGGKGAAAEYLGPPDGGHHQQPMGGGGKGGAHRAGGKGAKGGFPQQQLPAPAGLLNGAKRSDKRGGKGGHGLGAVSQPQQQQPGIAQLLSMAAGGKGGYASAFGNENDGTANSLAWGQWNERDAFGQGHPGRHQQQKTEVSPVSQVRSRRTPPATNYPDFPPPVRMASGGGPSLVNGGSSPRPWDPWDTPQPSNRHQHQQQQQQHHTHPQPQHQPPAGYHGSSHAFHGSSTNSPDITFPDAPRQQHPAPSYHPAHQPQATNSRGGRPQQRGTTLRADAPAYAPKQFEVAPSRW